MNLLPSVFRINQTGYRTGFPVFVSVLSDDPVRLIDDSGCVIREFSAKASHYDAASGDPVTLLNLGILHAGEYWLESGGTARKIYVSDTPWASVVDSLIKGLYFQRCGCELIGRYAGKYVHPACHTAAASEWDNRSAVRFVTGGWHDAGDYGKYVGPGAVTVGVNSFGNNHKLLVIGIAAVFDHIGISVFAEIAGVRILSVNKQN